MSDWTPKFTDPKDAQRFGVGHHWHSDDNGRTWKTGAAAPSPVRTSVRVAKVDPKRGVIVVTGKP